MKHPGRSISPSTPPSRADEKFAVGELLLDGEALGEVRGSAAGGESMLEVDGAASDLGAEGVSVEVEVGAGLPGLLGGHPTQCRAMPLGVQQEDHALESVGKIRGIGDELTEPGAVLAVLTFELTVVAGVAWRPVEGQDVEAFEDAAYRGSVVGFGTVDAPDEGGPLATKSRSTAAATESSS